MKGVESGGNINRILRKRCRERKKEILKINIQDQKYGQEGRLRAVDTHREYRVKGNIEKIVRIVAH